MSMKKSLFTTRNLCVAAIIAAFYITLTWSIPFIMYGPLQMRISEALKILPLFTPAAIPGLFIGVFIANIQSPFGLADMIIGSLATLIAAIMTYYAGKHLKIREFPKFLIAMIPPVVINALAIGIMLYVLIPDQADPATYTPIYVMMTSVGFGQIVACYVLGGILYFSLKKSKINLK